jgi:hypothetical protein
VDVEGSGEGVTVIDCECGGSQFNADSAVISRLRVTAEIRHLTINNTGTNDLRFSFGVYSMGEAFNGTLSMLHVTVNATGGADNYGVVNQGSLSMNNVIVTAIGGSSATGFYNAFGQVILASIRNSSISGTERSIFGGSTALTRIAHSILDGAVSGTQFTCSGVTTAKGVALGPDCQPDRVITVSNTGGDYPSLSAALASITDASATNPYVIRIAPGIYTESAPTTLKDHVDVEGSGQGVTTINCTCAAAVGFYGGASAVLVADSISAEIRHLTVSDSGRGRTSVGIYTTGVDASFSMLHVTVSATAPRGSDSDPRTSAGVVNNSSSPTMTNVKASATSVGYRDAYSYGVYNGWSSSPTMKDVTAVGTATGGNSGLSYGVYNNDSSPVMDTVIATGDATASTQSIGVYNSGSSPTIRNSTLTGSTASISGNSSGDPSSATIANTELNGVVSGPGFTCVGVYDSAFAELSASCANV